MYESDKYYMYLHVGRKFVRDPFVRYEGGEGDVVGDNVTEGANDIVGEVVAGEVASAIAGEAVHEGVHGDVVHEDSGEVTTQGASEFLINGVATDVVFDGADEDVHEGVHEEDVDIVQEGANEGVHEEVADTVQEGADKGVHEEVIDVVHDNVNEEVVDTVQEAANAIHEGIDGATGTVNEGVSVDLNDDDEWLQQSQMKGAVEVIGKDVHEGVADGTKIMNESVFAATDELQPTATQQNFYESETEDAYSEDGVYLMKVRYLSDGNDDDELQSARTTFKSFEGKTVNRCKKHVETDSDSVGDETQPEIRNETVVEEENVGTTCELDGNETDYFDSDDHESLVSSDDDEHDDAARRKTRFSKYNPNSKTLEFCLGMLFINGKQFKETIHKYSKTSRRELKIIKNEPKRASVKCIASAHCPWRIHAITNRMTSTCRRAKNLVSSRLAGNVKEEFANLWDYEDELRAKNPGSTIKMAMNRVTADSPPHFKRDDNNQMYPIAWAIVESETKDSWTWFLSLLNEDLGMEDGFGYTIISDQHKGLEFAISDILPRVEHKNCAKTCVCKMDWEEEIEIV
ncbi:hypothetical protein V6N12_041696 [Hibiscus sabdariffa]|uniref:Transposase MuDR plant domain-containing protein n=1 Tax=Hibiscus sabdariffa TaxID=183260 RepID=A0ABR2BIR6_9ROSI